MKWYIAFGPPPIGWAGFYGPYDDRRSAEDALERKRIRGVAYEIIECEHNALMERLSVRDDV